MPARVQRPKLPQNLTLWRALVCINLIALAAGRNDDGLRLGRPSANSCLRALATASAKPAACRRHRRGLPTPTSRASAPPRSPPASISARVLSFGGACERSRRPQGSDPDRPSGTVRWQRRVRARSSLLPASTCIGHVTTVNAVTIATDTKRMEPAGALPAGRLFRPEEALFCITELQWYLRRCCGAITTLMAPNDVRPLAVFGRDRGVNRHGAARAKPTRLYRVSDAGRGRAGRVRLAGVRKPSRNEPAVGSARRWCAGYGYLADTGLARWWPCSALTEPMRWFLARAGLQ